jgi:hypothetical protein
MDSARFCRAAVALIAAYAIALQALLSVAGPAVAAPVSDGILCSDDPAGQHPVPHDKSCATACAALGPAAGGLPAPGTDAVVAPPARMVAFVPPRDWIAPEVFRGPQAPRGPPCA